MTVRGAMIGVAGAMALAACDRTMKPPTHTGVCWRLAEGLNGTQDFRPMTNGVANLQACAVQLEGLRLKHGVPMTGAYQGQIIFVTDQEITAAASTRARRYPLFTPAQRAEMDAGLRQLLAQEGL